MHTCAKAEKMSTQHFFVFKPVYVQRVEYVHGKQKGISRENGRVLAVNDARPPSRVFSHAWRQVIAV